MNIEPEIVLLKITMLFSVVSAFSYRRKIFIASFLSFIFFQASLAWYQDYLMSRPDYNGSVGDGFVLLVVYFPTFLFIFCFIIRLGLHGLVLIYHSLKKRRSDEKA